MKRSQEILDFYTNEVTNQLDTLQENYESFGEIVCIALPIYEPEVKSFNIDIGSFASQYVINKECDENDLILSDEDEDINNKEVNEELQTENNVLNFKIKEELDDTMLVVTNEAGELFYEINEEGQFVKVDKTNIKDNDHSLNDKTLTSPNDVDIKCDGRKKRMPMDFIKCKLCPIKYRFVSKLKEHMKTDHNIQLFVCKVSYEIDLKKYFKIMLHLFFYFFIHNRYTS